METYGPIIDDLRYMTTMMIVNMNRIMSHESDGYGDSDTGQVFAVEIVEYEYELSFTLVYTLDTFI